MIKTGIFNSFNKTPVQDGSKEIKLFMAKNEGESCVITVLSDTEINDASLRLKGEDEGFKIEIEQEYFMDCNGKKFPDPLVPVTKFNIENNKAVNLLVRFTSNNRTEAGDHRFVFVLLDKNGVSLCEYVIDLHIWNFALPEKYTVNTSMAILKDQVERFHKPKTNDELDVLYKKYYDFLLDYRVSAFTLPYDILDDKADQYLSDPRVTSFLIDHTLDDETLSKQYEKLNSHPEWVKKAVIYPLDEPLTKEHLDTLIAACEKAKRLYPNIRRTSAFYKNIAYDEQHDQVEILLNNCDLILPKLTCYNDEFIYDYPEHKEKYGSFQARMTEAQKQGKEIWQYVCWEPGKPYVNMYVDESGLDHRILFWQQHLVGATGFLYWATNWWRLIDDPWETMATVPDLSSNVFGDGSLLYYGSKVGIDGPCASVRLEAVRDGIEDCEMLLMADKALGREWVLEKVKTVSSDLKNYTDSAEVFNRVRNEIASALEKALNK